MKYLFFLPSIYQAIGRPKMSKPITAAEMTNRVKKRVAPSMPSSSPNSFSPRATMLAIRNIMEHCKAGVYGGVFNDRLLVYGLIVS